MAEADDIEDFEGFSQSPEVYPLDWTTLQKGDDVPAERVSAITGVALDHPRFPFALLALRDFVVRESGRCGRPLSVCTRRQGLHINTDSEAVGYHDNGAKKSQRAMFRSLYMLSHAIDVSKLTNYEQSRHTRALVVWGAKAAALRRAAGQVGRGLPPSPEPPALGATPA